LKRRFSDFKRVSITIGWRRRSDSNEREENLGEMREQRSFNPSKSASEFQNCKSGRTSLMLWVFCEEMCMNNSERKSELFNWDAMENTT
jgi:hypothetical protein